jgi:hypothetical protein
MKFLLLLLYWRYNPLWVLAFSVIVLHPALSLHRLLHRLIPIIYISSSLSTIHLFLGFPLILIPTGFHSNTLLSILLSSSRDLSRIFFCFLWISLCLRFLLVRLVRNSFLFSRTHLHFALGQRFFTIFCVQIFGDVILLGLLISKLHIRKSLQVLLNFCIFLALSFF